MNPNHVTFKKVQNSHKFGTTNMYQSDESSFHSTDLFEQKYHENLNNKTAEDIVYHEYLSGEAYQENRDQVILRKIFDYFNLKNSNIQELRNKIQKLTKHKKMKTAYYHFDSDELLNSDKSNSANPYEFSFYPKQNQGNRINANDIFFETDKDSDDDLPIKNVHYNPKSNNNSWKSTLKS